MPMEWFVPTLAPVVWVIIATVIMYIAVLLLARWSGLLCPSALALSLPTRSRWGQATSSPMHCR